MDELYSEKVIEHFMSPHNMHAIENADAEGYYGDPDCGIIWWFLSRLKMR